jgi:hypothetical protein
MDLKTLGMTNFSFGQILVLVRQKEKKKKKKGGGGRERKSIATPVLSYSDDQLNQCGSLDSFREPYFHEIIPFFSVTRLN